MKRILFTRKELKQFAKWCGPCTSDFYITNNDVTKFLNLKKSGYFKSKQEEQQ